MTNWSEGSMKIRGKVKDIISFLLTEIEFTYNSQRIVYKNGNGYRTIYSLGNGWIKGTRGGFIDGLEIEIDNWNYEDTIIIVLNASFAWSSIYSTEALCELSKKYNIDFKMYLFERGMEFNEDVEIVKGELIKDNCITFDDYQWECIYPNIGG